MFKKSLENFIPPVKTIIETLTELFDQTGLNQSQVAEKLGISPQLLGQYLKGRQKPKTDFWIKWHKVFGDDPLQMFTGKETNVSRETPEVEDVDKLRFYQEVIEGQSEYRLVPKMLLERYSIVPNQVLDNNDKTIDIIEKAKDKLISNLENYVAILEKENTKLKTELSAKNG